MFVDQNLCESLKVPYIILNDEGEIPLFTSTKQIKSEAECILFASDKSFFNLKLWTFKELLSWQIPDHLLSTGARDLILKL